MSAHRCKFTESIPKTRIDRIEFKFLGLGDGLYFSLHAKNDDDRTLLKHSVRNICTNRSQVRERVTSSVLKTSKPNKQTVDPL